MNLLKTLAMTAVVALAGLGSASAKDWSTIRIGTDATYPPFESQDANGEIKGFDMDLLKAMCDKMKAKCIVTNQDWDGIIPALLAGKFDAIVSQMSITEERMKKVDFTAKYSNTPPAIAVPKTSKLAGVTNADLKGITLGAQSSTTHANYAEALLTGATLKLYPTADEYKLDLVNGRLDAVIDDVVVLTQWTDSKDGACCKILSTLKPDPKINGAGAGIAVRKEDQDLKALITKAIADVRADGTYKKINDQYFKFDVYGE